MRIASTQCLLNWLNILSKEKILLDQGNITLLSRTKIDEEPTTFDQAWDNENHKIIKEKLREPINKEFEDMNKKELCQIIKKRDIPKKSRTI